MTAYNFPKKNPPTHWQIELSEEVKQRKEARRKVIEAAHRREREAYKRMMERRHKIQIPHE